VEVAKALGGSFKLVTLAPRTVREMIQLPMETQINGDTNKSKRKNKHASFQWRREWMGRGGSGSQGGILQGAAFEG